MAWCQQGDKPFQCWNIVKWTLRNKLQWNFNQNFSIFIQENAFESVICEMAAILSRPQCVTDRCCVLRNAKQTNIPVVLVNQELILTLHYRSIRKPLTVAIIQLARGHRLLPWPVAWPSLFSNDQRACKPNQVHCIRIRHVKSSQRGGSTQNLHVCEATI